MSIVVVPSSLMQGLSYHQSTKIATLKCLVCRETELASRWAKH